MRDIFPELMVAEVAECQLADQRWREYVRVRDCGVLGPLIIVTPIEGKVRNAAENIEGIQLIIVIEGVTAGEMILIRDEMVHPAGELVDVIDILRRGDVIFPTVPPIRFGAGYCWMIFKETGLMSDSGMMFPGNAAPVDGLITAFEPAKLPSRFATVGTDASRVSA